ncbi:hypothetical protein DAPPUDRAFT_120663 [Daphnia pulex]|uniref:Uncharacterized protein n=1 Tax=Daphnia pulex TaxID=6669 RepID=E9I1Y5_DAPPU|nr:hypothetical protein DAPPUDRAFT_120663 [Daphnia pulex]|eukprot:EFX61994.1 hypothetical protein DAPPUDRAFT_120663 [Daphnia pulex]
MESESPSTSDCSSATRPSTANSSVGFIEANPSETRPPPFISAFGSHSAGPSGVHSKSPTCGSYSNFKRKLRLPCSITSVNALAIVSEILFPSQIYIATFRNSPASRQLRAKAFKEERIKNKEANQLPEERRVVIFRHEEFQEAQVDNQVAEPQVDNQVAEPQVDNQVAEPQVDNQVAEPQVDDQVAEPQVPDQKVLEDRKRRAIEIFSCIQGLYRKIHPQLLPPVNILAQHALRYFHTNQPAQPREEEHPQLAIEDGDFLQLTYEEDA